MFEISPSVRVDAPPETVWASLVDVETWWVPSNPEHDAIEVLSDHDSLREGTRLRVEERVAGLPGVAEGPVTEFVPGERITWEAPGTRYRFLGLTITVDEGVTWSVEPDGDGTVLTAHVWARFPDTAFGTLAEWVVVTLLDGVERDYEHAMRELEYLKRQVES